MKKSGGQSTKSCAVDLLRSYLIRLNLSDIASLAQVNGHCLTGRRGQLASNIADYATVIRTIVAI
uniref:Transcriptional regulator n=1 Tax=Heterorhabditis bacteriophora TaxID=37862 RepID=A0A1I7XUA7_HETBA